MNKPILWFIRACLIIVGIWVMYWIFSDIWVWGHLPAIQNVVGYFISTALLIITFSSKITKHFPSNFEEIFSSKFEGNRVIKVRAHASLAKVIVVYESKYGNTKRVAETINEEMNEVEGIKAVLSELKEVDLNKIPDYDAILIGSPNHFGGPTRGIRKFIDKLGKLNLGGKTFAVFDTYIRKDFEKAVKKMEERINEKVPGLKQMTPGLSIKVQGTKGPILKEELPKCKEFGKKIANQLKRKRPKSIIRTYDLTRNFGDIVAVNKVNFEIQRGELFTFLGPNGAGKTTLVRLLACLLKPSSGTAIVGGHDIRKNPLLIRKMVGVVTQEPCLYIDLTGEENISFFGELYGMSRRQLEEKKEELLELVRLKGREKHLVGTYSGGMKQRLSIACAVIHEPQVVFFDEPTAGLDPQTKRAVWEYMRALRKEGVTVVLNTHSMEEADKLSDRVAIIDRGAVVAVDSPSQLKKALGKRTLEDVFIGLTGREVRD